MVVRCPNCAQWYDSDVLPNAPEIAVCWRCCDADKDAYLLRREIDAERDYDPYDE